MTQTVLITGAAGFIGFHLSQELLKEGYRIVGVDNLNDYYDPQLKHDRLAVLQQNQTFSFKQIDIADYDNLQKVFDDNRFTTVVNLAAQAGVRYSLENPFAYQKSNMDGFLNILELMRHHDVKNLVYASSSSVYGGIQEYPYHEQMQINQPVSLYAATKAANELYAHVYHNLFGIKSIGLRFFTVYGPWGRPDMFYFLLADALRKKETVKVFNRGNMYRSWTYVRDIVQGIKAAINKVPKVEYEVVNLGNSSSRKLSEIITIFEETYGQEVNKDYQEAHKADVERTEADTSKGKELLGWEPRVEFEEGIKEFVEWYKGYYDPTINDPF